MTAYYKEIRSQVAETEVFKDISETLITKILMGTLGCVPAYDRYFKSGLSLEGVGIQKYGNNSLIKVCEFYEKYNEELEVVRLNMNVAGLEYPQLIILIGSNSFSFRSEVLINKYLSFNVNVAIGPPYFWILYNKYRKIPNFLKNSALLIHNKTLLIWKYKNILFGKHQFLWIILYLFVFLLIWFWMAFR